MELYDWCKDELSELLDHPVSEDYISYFLSCENKKDVEELLLGLLDKSNPDHLKFISALLKKWNSPAKIPSSTLLDEKLKDSVDKAVSNTKKAAGTKTKNKQSKEKQNKPLTEMQHSSAEPALTKQKSKTKQKFVPLFSQEGQARTIVQIPGRHSCQCLASKHSLINNCLHCGRIVCQQEGSGPCLTCGNLVCSKEEMLLISQGGLKADELLRKLTLGKSGSEHVMENLKEIAADLMPQQPSKNQQDLDKALAHKNRLLEFDKTCEKRTRVIDDDADYFSVDSNQWLSQQERAVMEQRALKHNQEKHKSRLDRKITLDFAGRQVIEEIDNTNMYDPDDPIFQDILNLQEERMPHLGINSEDFPIPVYCSDDLEEYPKALSSSEKILEPKDKWKGNRLQDKELQEMSDEGHCLSMHQPYASLLICGLKKHEGRSWYTIHRGRLWIASAGKEPSVQEIKEAENAMKILSGEDNIIFPTQYPIGCLLGCVDVVDCLPQEEYREQYPEGESASPYVFICENPQELIVKFPIKGKHKIYKLDARIHAAAKKTLKKKF